MGNDSANEQSKVDHQYLGDVEVPKSLFQ